jgi:hypothetical protein
MEISVKSGKDRVSTPSLVIHRVRLKKNLQKSTLAFNGGWNSDFDGFLSFTLSFLFPERLHCCYIDFHRSYLYSYYNSSRTLCIKCWDSAFRTEFQHFILRFPYFADTTKRGVRGWKTGWIFGFLYWERDFFFFEKNGNG